MIKRIFSILTVITLLISCRNTPTEKHTSPEKGVVATHAMVVSAKEEASQIGLTILKKGGNAFDAMVATELALAVAYPNAGNIGGGGFMVYRLANGEKGALDYREKAPAKAHRDMYLDKDGNVIPDKSTLGALSVGVPGTIAGLFAVHQKFGSLPFAELIQPAIDLARNGVLITQLQVDSYMSKNVDLIKQANNYVTPFENGWKAGERFKYEEFAQTLERIRDNGKAEFYEGETAKRIVSYVQELGGILSLDDLRNYRAQWRKPITFTYKDLRIDYSFNFPIYYIDGNTMSTYENNNDIFIEYQLGNWTLKGGVFWLGMPSEYKMKSSYEGLVNQHSYTHIENNRNMLVFGVSYDFSKGKNNSIDKKLNNDTAPAAQF